MKQHNPAPTESREREKVETLRNTHTSQGIHWPDRNANGTLSDSQLCAKTTLVMSGVNSNVPRFTLPRTRG